MKRKHKVLFLVGISVAIILGVSFVVVDHHLDDVLFQKMYVEKQLIKSNDKYTASSISIFYVTNSYDNKRIKEIKFKDNYNNTYISNTISNEYEKLSGLYKAHQVFVDFSTENNIDEDYVIIKEGEVVFTDNSTQPVTFGEIYLHKELGTSKYFIPTASGTSTHGETYVDLDAQYSFTIEDIQSALVNFHSDEFEMIIDGLTLEEIDPRYHMGRSLKMEINAKGADNYIFQSMPKMTVKEDDGSIREVFIEFPSSLNIDTSGNAIKEFVKKNR